MGFPGVFVPCCGLHERVSGTNACANVLVDPVCAVLRALEKGLLGDGVLAAWRLDNSLCCSLGS